MRQLNYLILILSVSLVLACVLFYDATKTIESQIQVEINKVLNECHN